MLVRIIKWIVLVPIAIVLVLFAVANRQIVTVSLDPLGSEPPVFSVTAPLFVILLLALVLGVIVGGLATWFRQARWRRAARQHESDLRRLLRAQAERGHAEPPLPLPQADRQP